MGFHPRVCPIGFLVVAFSIFAVPVAAEDVKTYLASLARDEILFESWLYDEDASPLQYQRQYSRSAGPTPGQLRSLLLMTRAVDDPKSFQWAKSVPRLSDQLQVPEEVDAFFLTAYDEPETKLILGYANNGIEQFGGATVTPLSEWKPLPGIFDGAINSKLISEHVVGVTPMLTDKFIVFHKSDKHGTIEVGFLRNPLRLWYTKSYTGPDDITEFGWPRWKSEMIISGEILPTDQVDRPVNAGQMYSSSSLYYSDWDDEGRPQKLDTVTHAVSYESPFVVLRSGVARVLPLDAGIDRANHHRLPEGTPVYLVGSNDGVRRVWSGGTVAGEAEPEVRANLDKAVVPASQSSFSHQHSYVPTWLWTSMAIGATLVVAIGAFLWLQSRPPSSK